MALGYIIGTVTYPEEEEVLYESHGEKCLLANVHCENSDIPISISEYLVGKEGRYTLTGSMANTHRQIDNARRLFTYFRVLDINKVGDDVKDGNKLTVKVQLAADVKYTVNDKGKVLADFSAHLCESKDSTILHFQGAGPMARRLKRGRKNDIMTVTGHVINRRKVLRIVVDDFVVEEVTENGKIQESAAGD